jgi:outer membrane protein assembly factor BamB
MLSSLRKAGLLVLLLGVLFPASCSAQPGSGQGEYRTLTDSRGREVQARVLRLEGERVTIERRDGKQFTVPIATFSQADQDFLRGSADRKTPSATDDDWPRFRGPGGMGISDARGLPVEWDPSENLVWKTALPGPGASSPVTFGDRVYLTCYTGYFIPDEPGGSLEQLKRHLIALRLDDGQIVWDKAVAAKLPEEERIRDHGFAANSVAVDAERVYAFFGKTGVLAFDHDGNQLWQTDVGSKTNGWGTAASPVLYKDLVFINASVESESLVALDRKTGKEQWRAGGIREAWNTPLVVMAASGRQELVVASQGSVLAFDPDSGESLWSCKTDIGWYMVPSVVAADGVVYCLGGRSGTAALAVRAGGSGDVTETHRLWTSLKGSNVSSPVYLDGHLYWAHESREIAYCAKAATGEIVYEQRLDRAGQFYASALLADGRLYYVTRNGKTFVLAAKPQFEQLAVNDLSDRSLFNGSPAVAGSRLLLRSDKYLYCVGE